MQTVHLFGLEGKKTVYRDFFLINTVFGHYSNVRVTTLKVVSKLNMPSAYCLL